MVKAAKRSVGEVNSQDFTNTVWAFAKTDQSNTSPFAVVASAAKRCVGECNAQNLANMTRASVGVCEGRSVG